MIFQMKIFIFVSFLIASAVADKIDQKQLKCLVCRSSLKELKTVLSQINPAKVVEIGNKKVPLAQSEIHISEVLESICEKMSDYVRATSKTDGQLTLLKMLTDSGGMNPDMSKVDIIQDDDLNRSLKFYCDGIVEEYEEPIIEVFRRGEKNFINEICSGVTNYCNEEIPEADEITDRTEL